MKTFPSLLILLLSILLFNCSNEESSAIEDETEIEATTQIEGDLPPVVNFYVAEVGFDGQSVVGLTNTIFNITADKGEYWAEWFIGDENEHFARITSIIEKTPGISYELLTESVDGEVSFLLTKVSDDGIWKMKSSRDDFPNYLCDLDAADIHANDDSGDNSEETPAEIIASLGSDWVSLTKEDGEWIIYQECRYGSGGLYLDEKGGWVEFSGGGDAWSSTILDMKRIEPSKILLKLSSDLSGTESEIMITLTGEDVIIFDEGTDHEQGYVLSTATNLVRTVTEECDEEDM